MTTLPYPGSEVAVTCKSRSYYLYRTSDYDFHMYKGIVLESEQHDLPETFRITGPNERISIRVIPMACVTELTVNTKQVDLKTLKPLAPGILVIPVKSSKGKQTYVVTLTGAKGTCTCPGFQYRHTCRHISEAFKQIN